MTMSSWVFWMNKTMVLCDKCKYHQVDEKGNRYCREQKKRLEPTIGCSWGKEKKNEYTD